MARRVRVGTIGARYPQAVPGDEALLDQMRRHLVAQTNKVLPDRPDLILMPELCDRFGNLSAEEQRQFADSHGDALLACMARTAADNHCYIAYPTLTRGEADGTHRNSIILLDRRGSVAGTYHKMFPVIAEMEERGILAGSGPAVVECDFGRVGFVICFDLCFQEMIGPYRKLSPELMLFASAYHGGHVTQAWAYGTRSHFASAVPGLPSAILSPLGEVLAQTSNYHDHVTATLNLDCRVLFLGLNQAKLRMAKEKYGPLVRISDPGHLGAALLTSESDDFSADDVVREFGMEPVDPYFDRVRSIRERHLEP